MKNTKSCIQRYFENNILENIAVRVGRADTVYFDIYRSKSGTINENTLFDMASVTKIIATTSLALIAIDKGLLSIDDSIEKFFDCPEEKKAMTIRHLLTHTMGIGHKALNLPGNTCENIPSFILNIPNDIPIGSGVLYSCPGFILLGKILEKIYGKRLDEAFKEYVASPLNMTFTTFLPDKANNFVNSNLSPDDIGTVNDYNCRFLGGVCGNAGLFSNMTDLTKYVQMLLRHGAPLISEATFSKAASNYTSHLEESRGLGFLYVDERYKQTGSLFPTGSIGHCGHTGQSVFADPASGLYVIILSDATISTEKKYGEVHYDEVIQMREDLHNAVKEDLKV